MARIAGVNLPANKRVEIALTYVYGIGKSSAKKIVEEAGIDYCLKLPHRAFNRRIGQFSEIQTDPAGKIITQTDWNKSHAEWLPTQEDREYVQSLMQPVTEPGKIAGWISPPKGRINRQPFEFEFVLFN